MDHIRPYLQGHPHIRRARHAREPNVALGTLGLDSKID
jgi:hypothetical protein